MVSKKTEKDLHLCKRKTADITWSHHVNVFIFCGKRFDFKNHQSILFCPRNRNELSVNITRTIIAVLNKNTIMVQHSLEVDFKMKLNLPLKSLSTTHSAALGESYLLCYTTHSFDDELISKIRMNIARQRQEKESFFRLNLQIEYRISVFSHPIYYLQSYTQTLGNAIWIEPFHNKLWKEHRLLPSTQWIFIFKDTLRHC